MKNIKAKKSFKGKEGFFYKGHVKNVPVAYADELIKKELAEEVKEKTKKKKEDIVEIKVDAPKETKKDKK